MNVDGAIFSKHKWSGIGVIARDDQGLVVAAMSKKLELPLRPLEIEAKVLEQAAIFAKDINLQKVIFESYTGGIRSLPIYCQYYCRNHTPHADVDPV